MASLLLRFSRRSSYLVSTLFISQIISATITNAETSCDNNPACESFLDSFKGKDGRVLVSSFENSAYCEDVPGVAERCLQHVSVDLSLCNMVVNPYIGEIVSDYCLETCGLCNTSVDAWKKRVIYQVLTDRFAKPSTVTNESEDPCTKLWEYCGGTYRGLTDNLDYIVGMGFNAIWISPIVKNYDQGYHGYWATNFYELNPNFGTDADLHEFVAECHDRNIAVMVDVVANHVGPVGYDYSSIVPFNKESHYHPDCSIDYNDQESVEKCRLAGLPDLKQESSYVNNALNAWVKNIVALYKFDGVRIDTVKHMPITFWRDFSESAGVFQMGEHYLGDPAVLGPYQNEMDSLKNYPMYYTIKDVFGPSSAPFFEIRNRYDEEDFHFRDVDALGVFIDNHDVERFLSFANGDTVALKAALTFCLTSRGIPMVYYGTEQFYSGGADPNNRESLWQSMHTDSDLYQHISKINFQRSRNEVWLPVNNFIERWVSNNLYVYSRGMFLVALTNTKSQKIHSLEYHPFKTGDVICNIFYPTDDCQTISEDNKVLIWLNDGESKIFVLQDDLVT